MSILERIAEHAAKQPAKLAFCNAELNDESMGLTYDQLEDESNRLAVFLEDKLGENRSPLVVYGHKSPMMLVCFIACVKTGRAYCPVDTSVPADRVKSIIEEAAPPLVLLTEDVDFEIENSLNIKQINEAIKASNANFNRSLAVSGNDVFYIIFTSGSTGVPKGVQITSDCLENFIEWAKELGQKNWAGKDLTVINQAPFSFDLSVMDLYLSLYLGATLWMLSKPVQADMKRMIASLGNSGANIWVSTPSFAEMCLADYSFNSSIMPEMELFLFCGETLNNQTVSKLHAAFPAATVVNTYGPTESTVAVTDVIITPELNAEVSPLPVGCPKPGTTILICDSDGKRLPEGEKGEIIITGNTVSCGYFRREDITNKSFYMETDGQRAYHTGDEGYIKDGMLYYCGRIDLQIKLHGYRIEIEDIENNLARLDEIESAIAVPVLKDGKIRSLTAFVVANHMFDTGEPFSASQIIRKKMAEFVPDYMIPKKIIFIENIPMTNNGKADRKKLGGLLK